MEETVDDILATLRALGRPDQLPGMARYGMLRIGAIRRASVENKSN